MVSVQFYSHPRVQFYEVVPATAIHCVGDAPREFQIKSWAELRGKKQAVAIGIFGAPSVGRASSQP